MYKEHYRVFSQNVEIAARNLHYYLEIRRRALGNKKVLKALNISPRFWNDFNFISIQTVVIVLGKIFDSDPKSHSIDKTINAAAHNLDYFNKASLQARKVASGLKEAIAVKYVANAHELTIEDIRAIKDEIKRARVIWKKLKPLRQKVYAHDEIITQQELADIYAQATYEELDELVQILLSVAWELQEAEYNGKKPSFTYDNEAPIKRAKAEVRSLLKLMLGGYVLP